MFKKTAIAALVGMAVAGSANALSISAGDIKFTLDNYDAGTTGYAQQGVDYGSGTTLCNTVGTCDAAAGTPAPGGIGSEDSWGIFTVAKISSLSTGLSSYTEGLNGQYLVGVFYGLTDYKVIAATALGTTFEQAYAQGGSFDLWLTSSPYNPALGPAGRIGAAGYSSITDVLGAVKVLSANFSTGVNLAEANATYQNLSQPFNAYAGSGQGFLDITYTAIAGGYDFSNLDTDAQVDTVGNFHDLFLDTSYSDANNAASALGWTVKSVAEVTGNALPEPGSMALAGLGLIGLAALRRRKQA